MSDAVLTVLRLGFLALLWVFFLRIASAVWTSAAPRPAVAASEGRSRKLRKANGGPAAVVILEPVEQAGLVFPVTDQSQHARVAKTDAGLMVSDLGSTNGTYVDREKVTTPIQVSRGAKLQIGSTVMEVR